MFIKIWNLNIFYFKLLSKIVNLVLFLNFSFIFKLIFLLIFYYFLILQFVNLDIMVQIVKRNVVCFVKNYVIVILCLGIVKKDVEMDGKDLIV